MTLMRGMRKKMRWGQKNAGRKCAAGKGPKSGVVDEANWPSRRRKCALLDWMEHKKGVVESNDEHTKRRGGTWPSVGWQQGKEKERGAQGFWGCIPLQEGWGNREPWGTLGRLALDDTAQKTERDGFFCSTETNRAASRPRNFF
jgi:hypothetical protein